MNRWADPPSRSIQADITFRNTPVWRPCGGTPDIHRLGRKPCGGDSQGKRCHTIGAIVGALMGTRLGVTAIPSNLAEGRVEVPTK